MPSTATRVDAKSFRYESDMVPVLRAALPRLAFRHGSSDGVEVFTEVPAVHGIPDLAAIRFDVRHIEIRRLAGVRPLTTDTEVRVVLAVGAGGSAREIAQRSGLSADYVRRAVLPLLSELGWVEVDPLGNVTRRAEARWVGRRVVTVEAKLRDWRKALAQARRQQLSADVPFIALDAQSLRGVTEHLQEIAGAGIGVIAVDANQRRAHVMIRPARVQDSRRDVGRALLAERSLDMIERGTREGQIYPVFGRTLPPTT